MRRKEILVYVIFACLMLVFLPSDGMAGEDDACLECHGEEGFSKTLEDGTELSVYVDVGELRRSVHRILDCSSCHEEYSAGDHPEKSFDSQRDFSLSASRACTGCHTDFEGIHEVMVNQKEVNTVCTDCHSAHAVQRVKDTFTDNQYCIGCHNQALHVVYRDGGQRSAQVNADHIKVSVHNELGCADCHYGFSSEEHPERSFRSHRDHTIASSEICRRCHFDKYTRTLESIHYELFMEGRTETPVCVDCHGAHSIFSGRPEKILNARRCGRCHDEVYKIYKDSVHGGALISQHNQDVPTCTDCHRAHDVADPRTAAFHLRIPDLCGNCHADERLMQKYDLSTAVVDTYIQDFHGITLSFYKQQGENKTIAVCVDCHGIHDITKTNDPDSPAVKSNLVRRCQKCHPDATENFPDSWLSHYEPSLRQSPLVFLINLTYKVFIPFMIVGLVLQILLHVWRYAVNR